MSRKRSIWARLFGSKPAAEPSPKPEAIKRRHFEGSETNRLNEFHWLNASDEHVNKYLIGELKTLRARCTYEARNSPLVRGVVEAFKLGVLGQEGPKLQVQHENAEKSAEVAEKLWREWWENPDLNGQLTGYDFMAQWLEYLPTAGEFVAQIVGDPDGDRGAVLFAMDPRRLRSLATFTLEGSDGTHWMMGVKRNRNGKPLRYSFAQNDDVAFDRLQYFEVPSEFIIHEFQRTHPGQVRGIPWLSSCLDSVSELRDFDRSTLRAARIAADHGILLQSEHIDAPFVNADTEIEIEPGLMSTLPPGWKAMHFKPEHPANNYVEFRHDRAREIGRPFNMPLMMVLLDSSGHNFSSARFDAQLFQRDNARVRKWLETRVLNRLLRMKLVEWRVTGRLTGDLTKLMPRWNWQPVPHVDPVKEANAAQVRMETGISTATAECAALGFDYEEDVLRVKARESEQRNKVFGSPDQKQEDRDAADAEAAEDTGRALFESLGLERGVRPCPAS